MLRRRKIADREHSPVIIPRVAADITHRVRPGVVAVDPLEGGRILGIGIESGYALVDLDKAADGQHDVAVTEFIGKMRDEDILMITADHGCDPGFTGTDHTREYIPLLIYGKDIKAGVNVGTRTTFADIAATILDIFNVENNTDGLSFKSDIMK